MSQDLTIQPAYSFAQNTVGAWAGVPADLYHKSSGESNSSLKLLADSPARYQMHNGGKLPLQVTKDMLLGTLIHSIVTGEAAPYHVRPDTYSGGKKWNGNASECKEWVAAHSDKPIIDGADVAMLASVTDALRRSHKLTRLTTGAWFEVSACARNDDQDLPYLLRVRFDILGRDAGGWYFGDVKSVRDASTDEFQREIWNREYHAQMAIYRRVLKRLTGETPRAFIIGVEKSKTLSRVNVRQLSQAAMDAGDAIIDDRLRLLKRCRLSNTWPDFADDEGGENIQFIGLPEWCQGGTDGLTGMTETSE